MTTSVSTVGYGDICALKMGTEPTSEMLYLALVIITGIILFALITNEIFSYRKMLTVQEIMREKSYEMEGFMYSVSSRKADQFLPTALIKNAVDGI